MFLNNSLTTYKERFLNTPFYRLIMDIEAKIVSLSEPERKLFMKTLKSRLNDRGWSVVTHGIDYFNLKKDMKRAKEILYTEMLEEGTIHPLPESPSRQNEAYQG